MRLTRRRTELPVLDPGAARYAAIADADANGIIPAQARTREAVLSGAAAWVGLVLAPDLATYDRRITLVDRAGREREITVAITIRPLGATR